MDNFDVEFEPDSGDDNQYDIEEEGGLEGTQSLHYATFYEDLIPPNFDPETQSLYPAQLNIPYEYTSNEELARSFADTERQRENWAQNPTTAPIPKFVPPPYVNKKIKAIIQTCLNENKNNIHNLKITRHTSEHGLNRSYGTVRIDSNDQEGMSNLRQGNCDEGKCLTCPEHTQALDPVCSNHSFHQNLLLPIVQSSTVDEKKELTRVFCLNCSASLLRTGTISRDIDSMFKIDPLNPIPMTSESISLYQGAGWPIPSNPNMTRDDVLLLKEKVLLLEQHKLTSNTAYLNATVFQNQSDKWPIEEKNMYNQSLDLLKKHTYEYHLLQKELSTLPVNMHTI